MVVVDVDRVERIGLQLLGQLRGTRSQRRRRTPCPQAVGEPPRLARQLERDLASLPLSVFGVRR